MNSTDYIVIAIILVLVAIGIISGAKHFKGESGCCGGGSYVPKKKKLKHVLAKKTVIIEGMTCEHCKNRVEEKLNDIKGVSATVNLKKKEATILMEIQVDEKRIYKAIEKAGYTVVELPQ